MSESNGTPAMAKWPGLYPVSLPEKPASFADCLLAVTTRFSSFFRNITRDVKPVWITGTVTGISEYQPDRWYVELRGPNDAYLKAFVNPKADDIEEFDICDTLKVEGTFVFVSKPPHLDRIQIQFKIIRAVNLQSRKDLFERIKARKPEPDIIKRIGIVTSPNSKALSDFYSGLGEHLLKSVSVEVEDVMLGKSSSILEGIRTADSKGYDVLIITRGGGMDLDLFNLPLMIETLRQCQSFTLSAIGHTDDEMVFDLNADMACPTPHAAGSALQKHINISRKVQQNITEKSFEPSLPTTETKAVVVGHASAPEPKHAVSWLLRIKKLSHFLGQWTWHSIRIVFFTSLILLCMTLFLYLLKNCAIPAAKMGKGIWEQVNEKNEDSKAAKKRK